LQPFVNIIRIDYGMSRDRFTFWTLGMSFFFCLGSVFQLQAQNSIQNSIFETLDAPGLDIILGSQSRFFETSPSRTEVEEEASLLAQLFEREDFFAGLFIDSKARDFFPRTSGTQPQNLKRRETRLLDRLIRDESLFSSVWSGEVGEKKNKPQPRAKDQESKGRPQEHSESQIAKDIGVVQVPVFSVESASNVNPILGLQLRRPEEIGRAEAKIILRGMGLMDSSRSFEEALQGLFTGHTYKSRKQVSLDASMQKYLMHEYRLLRKALKKYSNFPEISQQATPKLFAKWMQKASLELSAIPSVSRRYALLQALVTQESGRVHWKNFSPLMGRSADIGFGQFLPATAQSVGINPYDPEENIKGIAIYLNRLIGKHGIEEGLARYNGGTRPPPQSYAYASSILKRMNA
jgi:hypothetical protein